MAIPDNLIQILKHNIQVQTNKTTIKTYQSDGLIQIVTKLFFIDSTKEFFGKIYTLNFSAGIVDIFAQGSQKVHSLMMV